MEPTMEPTPSTLTRSEATDLFQREVADPKFRKRFQTIVHRAFPRTTRNQGTDGTVEHFSNGRAAKEMLQGDPSAADDLLGDVALWFFERVASGMALDDRNIRGLLVKVARGLARDRLTRSALRFGHAIILATDSDHDPLEDIAAEGEDVERSLVCKQLLESLDEGLTERDWNLLEAKANWTYDELAEELGEEAPALRQRARRLCLRLQAQFGASMPE